MQYARPPGGFRVVVVQRVKDYIEAEARENFRISQYWQDILDRVKLTALREARKIAEKPPTFTFIAMGAVDFHIPTIQIVFTLHADTMTVTAALVWTDDDYEEEAMGR